MSLAKTKKQVVDYATVNIQLCEALQALFDECVIADVLGELSEAVTGETLDKAREALKAAEQPLAPDGAGRAATLSGLYNCQACGEEKCRQPGICEGCLTPPTEEEVKLWGVA